MIMKKNLNRTILDLLLSTRWIGLGMVLLLSMILISWPGPLLANSPAWGDETHNGMGSSSAYIYQPAQPELSLPNEVTQLMSDASGISLMVPIRLTSHSEEIASLAFSLDYDQSCLSFDNQTDENGDQIPDAMSGLPSGFQIHAQQALADTDGELDIMISSLPVISLKDGSVLNLAFELDASCVGHTSAGLSFSTDPSVIFGNTAGERVVPVVGTDGPIAINIAPSEISLSNQHVDEQLPIGSPVGTFSTVDLNRSDTHSYSLVPGDGATDNSLFTLEQDGQLKTNAEFDFEQQNSLSIRVRSDDGRSGTFEEAFTIRITPIVDAELSLLHSGDYAPTISLGGQPVLTTLHIDPKGNHVSALEFALDYDQTCLQFDASDSNSDGIPDAMSQLPDGFSVSFDGNDSDGELSISLHGGTNTLTNSDITTLEFVAKEDCASGTHTQVRFSNDPTVMLTNTVGSAVPHVIAVSDPILILSNDRPGDCNSDDGVDAGDIPAIGLEILDEDGSDWLNVHQGSFVGSPVGCDANRDKAVGVADLICSMLIFFGDDSCTSAPSLRRTAIAAGLSIPAIDAVAGESVEVPIRMSSNGHQIAGAAFSLEFDQESFSFDPADENEDGIPDAITFTLPHGALNSATFDAQDNRLNVVVGHISLPQKALSDGTIATVTLQVKDGVANGTIRLTDASLSDTKGRSVRLTSRDGQLHISK